VVLAVFFGSSSIGLRPWSVGCANHGRSPSPFRIWVPTRTWIFCASPCHEIATALSYVHSLSIRPFATTSNTTRPSRSGTGGRDMRVTISLWTLLERGRPASDHRGAVDVQTTEPCGGTPSRRGLGHDCHAAQITSRVRQGLLPALGTARTPPRRAPIPGTEEASICTCAASRCP